MLFIRLHLHFIIQSSSGLPSGVKAGRAAGDEGNAEPAEPGGGRRTGIDGAT